MSELVSVIVPVYNVEKYLEKCIRSILNQTYKNLQIILVDDGSKDDSANICEDYAKTDARIEVIHKIHEGPSGARNAGIDIAKGEYFVFIDSDDYVKPEMIEHLMNKLKEDDADLAICDMQKVDEEGNKIEFEAYSGPMQVWNEDSFWEAYYAQKNVYCIVVWNKLYKRYLFDDIRFTVGKLHEDEFIIHHLIAKCNRISCSNEKMYYYVQRANSIMSNSFSIKRMDIIESRIQRSLFFQKRKKQFLAEKTLTVCIGHFLLASENLDMKNEVNKRRYIELKHDFIQAYKITKKTSNSLKFKVNVGSFAVGKPFYIILHKLFNHFK